MESMTISSRLRPTSGRQGTLQDIEDTINSTGRRRIAKFEMSIANPEVLSKKSAEALAEAKEVGTTTSNRKSGNDSKLSAFDIDSFSKDYKLAMTKDIKREHIFARAESYRGAWQLLDDPGRRPRDRYGDGPAVER